MTIFICIMALISVPIIVFEGWIAVIPFYVLAIGIGCVIYGTRELKKK